MAPALNPLAAACDVKGWLTPQPEQIQEILQREVKPKPLRICSGGTTSRCAEDQHWSLDLSGKCRAWHWDSELFRLRFGTGWTMGALQDQLARQGRMVPTGLSGLPGAGFLLTGGMGPLSRSLGLAIDHLQSIQGIWGNGSCFSLQRPSRQQPLDPEPLSQWRGLLGAGLFLGVICEIEIATLPLQPIRVLQGLLSPHQLSALSQRAETFPLGLTLQWCWADRLEVMLVANRADRDALQGMKTLERDLALSEATLSDVAGLHQLPRFGALSFTHQPLIPAHQEVVGLLANTWGPATAEIYDVLHHAMATRPHERCSIASQQLGGVVGDLPSNSSSFVHRQAEWKPWITASWPEGDPLAREKALAWLEVTWNQLEPHCQGIHLAQLHDHLPWHERELTGAFGAWLPQLRRLKQQLDPGGALPRLC